MPSDTTPEAEQVLLDLFRNATVADRIARVCSLTATVVGLSRRAIARAHPEFSPAEVDIAFVELHYGKELAGAVRQYLEVRNAAP